MIPTPNLSCPIDTIRGTGARRIFRTWYNTEGFAKTLAFSPDGKTLAVGHGVPHTGGGVELWDVARHSKLAEMPLAGTKGTVLSVAFSPDGETLAGACSVNDRSAFVVGCDA